jgi:acetylornithine/succinyldiaminopimelate/putrescine aminotransferase
MLGLVLDRPGAPLVDQLRERGFIVNCTQETILRFVPPLIIDEEQVDSVVAALDGLLAGEGGA